MMKILNNELYNNAEIEIIGQNRKMQYIQSYISWWNEEYLDL